ncbi:MAG: hypothetical protein SFX73_27365 [Kofleriaceae bacterium]|nr:hypothetical protein [Kofleriaceae bacterium]
MGRGSRRIHRTRPHWRILRSPAYLNGGPVAFNIPRLAVPGWEETFLQASPTSWILTARQEADVPEALRYVKTKAYETHADGWAGDLAPPF